jgi:glyoxalase family protein
MEHLHGIHHITAITADARRNVDFYSRILGLRLVKKTVNFDAPEVYHLYFGSEQGEPGSIITFFEFPDAAIGRAGAGMVHRIIWRVGSESSLDFWAERLGAEGIPTERDLAVLRFSDPEGLELELEAVESHDPPLAAAARDIPPEHGLLGFLGVRAYAADPQASHYLLTGALRFSVLADNVGYRMRGGSRSALYHYDTPPEEEGIEGAGTVHHIAWACSDESQTVWRERAIEEGARPTEVIDRLYFKSIYFREPSGVLFEIATFSPGFAVDEPADRLGESLALPPWHEHLREQLERTLLPLTNPRAEPVGR